MGFIEAGTAVLGYKAGVWGVSAIYGIVKGRWQAKKLKESGESAAHSGHKPANSHGSIVMAFVRPL